MLANKSLHFFVYLSFASLRVPQDLTVVTYVLYKFLFQVVQNLWYSAGVTLMLLSIVGTKFSDFSDQSHYP